MEIVRLQERLLVQSKLERDLKDLASKNEELVSQLKDMSQLQTELKKKASLIRNLEAKLKNIEVLEIEVESQALVIQRLQAAVDERSLLLAKLQNCPSRPTSNGSSPVFDRKLEEMEMVMAGLREMVDKSTKELSQKDEKIQALTDEKKSSVESLENEVQSLKTAANSLEAELQSLKKEKEAFEVLKKTLENELETLKVENGTISESKNSLEKELENSKKEKEAFEVLKKTLENELETLKVENGTISESKNSLENSKKEKEAFEVLKKTLENELETLKVENGTISESKNSLEKELENSKKENKEIYNLKNSLEKNLEKLKLENNDLKNSLLKDLENIKAEHKTISSLKNTLEKDFEMSKTEVKTILDLKSSLTKELESLKAENELISSMKNSLEKDLRNCEEEKENISDVKNSLEKEIQILREENGAILEQKECLHSELLSVKSELDSKSLEILALKSAMISKESVGEKSNIKATNELKNSLALAKMAQRELEENLGAKKKELRAKDAELTKMSKLLEQKNQENTDLESKISVLCREQDAVKCRVTELTNKLERKKETNNLQSENVGEVEEEGSSLSQEEKMKTLEEEVSTLEKSLEDNVQAREKLLIEISSFVSSLAEKDRQIAELTNGKDKGENTLKTVIPVTSDEEMSVAQLKADLNAEKQRCEELTMKLQMVTKEVDRLKSVDDKKMTTMQMKATTNIQCSQVKTPETVGKEDNGNNAQEEKSFLEGKKLEDPLLERHASQMETDSYEVDKVNASVKKQIPNDLGQDTAVLQTELKKVQSSLDAERSINQTLQFELDATNARLDEMRTDYDNEKNVSFNLKYELDDVKGSLNEVFYSFDQLNQTRNDAFIENKGVNPSDEIDKKLVEDLVPEKRQIVEDLQKQIKSWQAKYEESSKELISERQKLLDAQHSRSENFYLRRDNDKLQKQLSFAQKQLQDLESRQEIQQITLETDQMTKKIIEDRKKSEEQHLRDDLDELRKELGAAQEKVKSYGELEAEVKQLQEKVASLEVADKIEATPQDAMASVNEVDQTGGHSEVRLDEKFKYEDGKEREEEEHVPSINEERRECKDIRKLGYEIEVLSKELAAAQKEVQYLRDKVEAKDKAGSLASTPLLDTKVGSNRQLRREKIQAESAKMEAEFALKIAQEEIQSLTKRLEKFERKVSVGTAPNLDSAMALENAKKEILHLKDKVEEYESKISAANDQTEAEMLQKKELQDLEVNFKDEKAKVSKLEEDNGQKMGVIGILKESLKEQDDLMIGFEKLLDQKDDVIKNLNIELSKEKRFCQEEKENLTSPRPSFKKENLTSPRPSFEKEKLKTVVSNQTETIQVLSQRNTQQELTCETIRNELQNRKMSLSIITAERDSLRKRLHLAEKTAAGTCKCNNSKVTTQTLNAKSPQKSSDAVSEKKKVVGSDSTSSSDEQYWHQQRALVVENISKVANCRRLEPENSSPKLLVTSPACESRRVKHTSGPHPETSSCTHKKMCLSPESDQSSPPPPGKTPSSSALPRGEYIEIDVTPPVAVKALKRNRKRKPLELPAQDRLNNSKLSISTKSFSLCRRANVSDEEPSSGQEMPIETPSRPHRLSKSVAMKKIQQMSGNMNETSPINKRKKSVDDGKTSASDDHMSDSSMSKGKNALSRIKNLTSSFRSPSFKGAKNLLTSPHTWSMKDTPKRDIPGSPKSPWTLSSRAVTSSSYNSKKTNSPLNTSDADFKSHRDLRNLLSDVTTGPQRKRRLYKEEIIGPMNYERQIVKTRTMTTVRPKEDVFSIVKQQLRDRHK